MLVVALSAVALMTAGVFLWPSPPSSDSPPLGPGATDGLSRYAQARSIGEYRLVLQTSTLPWAYCLAVADGGRVAVGGNGHIGVGTLAEWGNSLMLRRSEWVVPVQTLAVPALFEERSSGGRVLSLAFDTDGTLFVGLSGGIVVQGEDVPWKVFFERSGSQIVNIVVTDEMIFAADAASRVVLCLDRDGNLVREIDGRAGEDEADSAGFVLPSPHWGMAMGADGLLRIANPGRRQVEAWTVDGHREFVWGRRGPGVGEFSGCCNPAALAVLDDGRIITAEKGELLTVTAYHPDGPQAGTMGQVARVVAGPDRFRMADGAVSLAVMPDGTVLVLQTPGGVLSVFEPPRDAGILPASGEENR